MSSGWVCLMYHDVLPEGSVDWGTGTYFAVERRQFAAQLDQLAAEGYRVRSLESTLQHPAARQVALTFDDGDRGQAEQAFPELARRGMTATFFITTSWVGRPAYASWDALREMKAAGMSIQSHTCTHPFLSELPPDRVAEELGQSRLILDEALSQRTTSLALPNGDYPRGGMRPLREAGYTIVANSRWGRNGAVSGAPRPVRRCTVRGAPSAREFRRITAGDPLLGARMVIRETTLNTVRSLLGPTRYARWRRLLLDTARRPHR